MRKRTFTLAALMLLTAATMAIGWATQASTSPGSIIANSKGAASKVTRESAIAAPKGDEAQESFRIAGSAGTKSKLARESA